MSISRGFIQYFGYANIPGLYTTLLRLKNFYSNDGGGNADPTLSFSANLMYKACTYFLH